MDILPSTFINYLNNCHKGYKMIIYVLVRPETEYSNTFKMVLLIYSGKIYLHVWLPVMAGFEVVGDNVNRRLRQKTIDC